MVLASVSLPDLKQVFHQGYLEVQVFHQGYLEVQVFHEGYLEVQVFHEGHRKGIYTRCPNRSD